MKKLSENDRSVQSWLSECNSMKGSFLRNKKWICCLMAKSVSFSTQKTAAELKKDGGEEKNNRGDGIEEQQAARAGLNPASVSTKGV